MPLVRLREIYTSRRGRLACTALLFTLLVSHQVYAQQQVAEAVPGPVEGDVPVKPTTTADPSALATPIDKRIMGVLPNYRTADGNLPFKKISAKTKLTIAAKDSFDGPNYVIGGIFAGIYQAENSHPGFGQGVVGYSHYYGTSFADQVIGNMLTEGFMPVMMHEDPRYFRKGHGSVWGRLGYSLTRTLITKTDSGRTMFNFAEVVGNGIGASISNLYYPDEKGVSDTGIRMGTQIATDSLSNVLKEFWPDIKRRMHKKDQASGSPR